MKCINCDNLAWTKGKCSACYKRAYYLANRAKESESRRLHNIKNRSKITLKQKQRESVDVEFKLKRRLRHRLYMALKNKKGSAVADLGCSVKHLKLKLQLKFHKRSSDGVQMTWNNYGEWHVDHIVPLAKFKLTDSEQLKQACHYSNLQPMWAKENLSKGSK